MQFSFSLFLTGLLLGVAPFIFVIRNWDNKPFIQYVLSGSLLVSIVLTVAIYWYWQGEMGSAGMILVIIAILLFFLASVSILFVLYESLQRILASVFFLKPLLYFLMSTCLLPITVMLSIVNYNAPLVETIIVNTVATGAGFLFAWLCIPKYKARVP